MYEELVKRLRSQCQGYGKECEDCNADGNCRSQMENEAADAIEALSKMEKTTRWIPVTERLPEEWTNVMTYQPTISQHDGLRRVGVYIGGDKWREAEHHNMMELPVTHWMPLPEPPKEKA